MATDSYDRQLQVLNGAKNEMEQLKRKIVNLKDGYANQINYAQNNAFMSDYASELQKKHRKFGTMIDGFINQLLQEQKKLEEHEQIINRLKQSANR
jgi:hypothetical protein